MGGRVGYQSKFRASSKRRCLGTQASAGNEQDLESSVALRHRAQIHKVWSRWHVARSRGGVQVGRDNSLIKNTNASYLTRWFLSSVSSYEGGYSPDQGFHILL